MSAPKFKAGMYLLETLTSGMYNEPLSIYREYIQNAVDSLDFASDKSNGQLAINITLDPFDRIISIHDSGIGIPAKIAEQTLSSIGSSDKIGKIQRGFRGIGRLGGIAFAEKAIFHTKTQGETIESIQEWNCKELRNCLDTLQNKKLSLEELFRKVTTFKQEQSKRDPDEGFFQVTLKGVESYRDQLFDIAKIKKYLCQVAPLPFHPKDFSFGNTIKNFLTKNLTHYGEYNIFINGEQIFRPYKDALSITSKSKNDVIEVVKLIELSINSQVLAYGWYGERRDLLGSISKGEGVSGIRVKTGNIMVGDAHLLDKCFREDRFNSYVIGEIHIDNSKLTPNSRRDDFVDNDIKSYFYNAVERTVGLPISKEIRLRSKLKSEGKLQLSKNSKQPNKGDGTFRDNTNNSDSIVKLSSSNSIQANEKGKNILLDIICQCKKKNCPTLKEILKNHQ